MRLLTITLVAVGLIPHVSGKATTTFPAAAGATTFSSPQSITDTFDDGMKRFGGGLSPCIEADGGAEGAIFILESGGTIKNAIIGADQFEGIHCNGPSTIQNVWFGDVWIICMGILAILWARFAVGYCISGGARGASDEIVQHNGVGTVEITDFFADTFGKIWTSCSNCSGNKGPREVILKGVIAKGGTVFTGANSNYGDTATIANSCGVTPSKICQIYEGCDKSKGDCESAKLSTGFDEKTCIDGDGNTAIC